MTKIKKLVPQNYAFANETEEHESSCKNQTIANSDGLQFSADGWKRAKDGLTHCFIGAGLAILLFFFACLILSIFNVGYILKALIAVVFVALAAVAYDKLTGEFPTPKKGAVIGATVIMFILCLLTGYQNAQGESAGFFDKIFSAKVNERTMVENKKDVEVISSESGTIRTTGEIWFASHIFSKGDVVKIEVEYNAVSMVGGRILQPGVYENEIMEGDGQIMFEGIAKNPSKVTITY